MKPVADLWEDVRESWLEAGAECRERLIPMLRAKAIIYVVIFVSVLSASGVWLAFFLNLYQHAAPRDVHLSVVTFAAAVAITGAFDGASQGRRSGFLLLLAFVAPLVCVFIPSLLGVRAMIGSSDWTLPTNTVSFFAVLFGILPSIVVWSFFNASDRRFAPESLPTAAAGGDPMQELG
jgi:hypothetical protein